MRYTFSGRRPCGFSVIELLVVVSILSMLIAMMLPALGRAREAAQMSVCQGNLQQFGPGLAMFADDNDGRIPQYDQKLSLADDQISVPWLTYRLAYAPNADGAHAVQPRNHGALFVENYLREDTNYFCPHQRGILWQLKWYPEPFMQYGKLGYWDGKPVEGSAFLVRSSYQYLTYRSSDSNHRPYRRLIDVPSDKALMMDLVLANEYYDTIAHEGNSVWNALHSDGSAQAHKSNYAYDEINQSVRLQWPEFELVRDDILSN